MIDNGAIPFIANIYPSHIEIYSQKYSNQNGVETYTNDKKSLIQHIKRYLLETIN